MEIAPLGKTGLNVSRLSFGASALGGVFRGIDEDDGIRAVRQAIDAGINYFDVAPAYGGGLAETVLGKALRGVSRDRYVLSTKAGKYTRQGVDGGHEFNYREARIRSGLEESMERLGVDFIDLVHLHDFEYEGGAHTKSAFEEGFPTLLALQAEGKIGHIGAGIYPLDLWQRVIASAPVGAILTHNHYSMADTRGLELIGPAREKSIGLINASPFASGLLTGGRITDWHPAGPAERRIFEAAAAFCRDAGSSLAKLAFQFSCHNSPFDTTMFSTASTISLQRNLAWYHEPLDTSLLAEIRAFLAPVLDKQWNYDDGFKS